MIQVVLVGHGALPDGVADAVELIAGRQPRLHRLGLRAQDSPDQLASRLTGLLRGGTGALVLADVLGGSPAIAAARVAARVPRTHVLAGLNLPMALAAVTSATPDLAELAAEVLAAGGSGVVDVGALLADTRSGATTPGAATSQRGAGGGPGEVRR